MMTIKEAREELNLTQKQVFEMVGVPVRTLQNWEAGIRVCPEYVERLIVAELFRQVKGGVDNEL